MLLGFHDSGRKERQRRDDPRALANVDMLEVETAIHKVMRDVMPHVVLTFDAHGAYYHPDHLAVHRAVTAAFFSSGVMGDDAPQRLFYSSMGRDVFAALAEASRGRGIVDGLDPDVFASAPGMIALTFDARPYLARKLSALAAHRSAFGVTQEMLRDPPAEAAGMLNALRPVLEREVFLLGGTRVAVPRWPLQDFFEGVQ